MAEESESGQKKTEQPTPKKLAEAKKRGQVPRSKELSSMSIVMSGALGLFFMGPDLLSRISQVMKQGLTLSRADLFDHSALLENFQTALMDTLIAIAPFLTLMLITLIVTPLLLGGWSFSIQSMAFKGDRMSPLKGLQRIFSSNGLMELVKSVAKFLLVSVVAVIFIWSHADELLTLSAKPLSLSLSRGVYLLVMALIAVSSALILIAAIDVPFQLWSHTQKLKMTLQEVRDEMKDTEGKPEVKSRIRQIQQKFAQGRMMEAVPEADVIITNPSHYAVALKYQQEKMSAPVVVALGTDLIALKIKEIATAHDVEIFAAPPLARALYKNSRLDQEIPGHLFFAVAQVLAFVFQLRVARAQGLDLPDRPDPHITTEEDF